MRAAHGAGPWWVTSFAWGGRTLVIKFRVDGTGKPDRPRLLALDDGPPLPMLNTKSLRRRMLAEAQQFCERRRDTIAEALATAGNQAPNRGAVA